MVMRKPGPLLAWFNRAPSYLYRAHLGALLGPRLVMITTTGRTSGRIRRTVVQVYARGTTPGGSQPPVLHVLASRGRRSDWYANATAAGRVRVDWMARRATVDVHRLDLDERAELLADYAHREPKAAALLVRAVLDEQSTGEAAQVRRLATAVRALRLGPLASAGADVAPPR